MQTYSTLTDHDLVALLQDGDGDAFTEVYNRYKGLLYIHAYRRLHDKDEVNDIIHELFATLWNRREEIVFTGQLSGYLYTSVRNRIIDFLSKKTSESNYISQFQSFLSQGEAVADHLIRERQLRSIIEKEIAHLPQKMREVFEMSRKQHLSHREIADQLELSELTVKKHVNNALKILRTRLGLIAYLLLISRL